MRRLGWFCALCLLAAAPAWAGNARELATQARAAYDRGDFPAAAAAYTELLAQGVDRAEVYYDLGNAEFKAGRIGRAVAAYRRALRRAPADEDVRYNLNYVRGFVRQAPDRTGPLARLAGDVVTWAPSAVLARAALAAYLLLAALAGAWLLTRGRVAWLRWGTAVAAGLFLFAASWAAVRIGLDRNARWGVVVSAQAEARNGPSAEYQVGFVIPEGREVRLLGREGTWVAVGLPAEGYQGWVQAADVLADE
jgi:tetratricopeptide (TPR) repeat protein